MHVLHAVGPDRVDGVLALYASAWWTKGRSREDVLANLAGSTAAVGVVDEEGTLVAFARALSDGLHRALVLDVIVAPEQRGAGVGGLLMRGLLDHPAMRDVESVALWCKPEHVRFYEELGFTDDALGMRLMLRGEIAGG